MRKWLFAIDLVFLTVALAILLIDYQIKEEIVRQAKALEATINGQTKQGTPESVDNSGSIHSPLLSGDGDSDPAVEDPASIEPRPRRARSPKGRNSGEAVGGGRDVDSGISGPSNELGS